MVASVVRVRDGERTRRAIFEAAVRVFAEKGFAGTSIRDLSEAAGVSTGLILHHFGTKQQLYESVKRAAYARVLKGWSQRGGPETGGDTFDRLRGAFYRARDNQTMQRIGLWARLEGDKASWPGEEAVVSVICEWIADRQREGAVRPDLTPLFLTIMISELTRGWWFYKERYWRLLGRSSDDLQTDPELDEAYLTQVLDIIARGVMIRSRQPGMPAKGPQMKGRKA